MEVLGKLNKYALILAGGIGRRAGGDVPKQFRMLGGRPLVWWSIKRFYDADPQTSIILVCHPGYFDEWQLLYDSLSESDRIPVMLCCGGRSRGESVCNGLMMIDDPEAVVAIHDGARPLVSSSMIKRGWESINLAEGVFPVIGVTDSLREKNGRETCPVDRDLFFVVQTPQFARAGVLKDAYNKGKDRLFTDDASLIQAAGYKVTHFQGETTNIKVTNPEDFILAEALLDMIQNI